MNKNHQIHYTNFTTAVIPFHMSTSDSDLKNMFREMFVSVGFSNKEKLARQIAVYRHHTFRHFIIRDGHYNESSFNVKYACRMDGHRQRPMTSSSTKRYVSPNILYITN